MTVCLFQTEEHIRPDHVNAENHIINWEEVTIIRRKSDWTTQWSPSKSDRKAETLWTETRGLPVVLTPVVSLGGVDRPGWHPPWGRGLTPEGKKFVAEFTKWTNEVGHVKKVRSDTLQGVIPKW